MIKFQIEFHLRFAQRLQGKFEHKKSLGLISFDEFLKLVQLTIVLNEQVVKILLDSKPWTCPCQFHVIF